MNLSTCDGDTLTSPSPIGPSPDQRVSAYHRVGLAPATPASSATIPGTPDTPRAPPFFQADDSIDRRWVSDKWTFTGYLDVQNVTNRANPEALFPNYNCQGYSTLTGIPIFPSIGLRAEF